MTTERQVVINQVLAFPPGGFAGVFLAPAERKVFKLFKNYKHPDVSPERGVIEDELRRLVFEAERRAYEIASADEELQQFIPVFYGSPKVSRVVALDGQDITNHYLLDCCLELQQLEGECVKFESIRCRFEPVEALFHRAGIRYTKDMSAFLEANGNGIKLIDFAIRDAYGETEIQWINDGKI